MAWKWLISIPHFQIHFQPRFWIETWPPNWIEMSGLNLNCIIFTRLSPQGTTPKKHSSVPKLLAILPFTLSIRDCCSGRAPAGNCHPTRMERTDRSLSRCSAKFLLVAAAALHFRLTMQRFATDLSREKTQACEVSQSHVPKTHPAHD